MKKNIIFFVTELHTIEGGVDGNVSGCCVELRANPAAHHGQGLPDMQQGKANQLAILPPAVRKHQRSRRRSLHKKNLT